MRLSNKRDGDRVARHLGVLRTCPETLGRITFDDGREYDAGIAFLTSSRVLLVVECKSLAATDSGDAGQARLGVLQNSGE